MITEELKLSLLKELARDKKLTYTAYILLAVVIAVVLALAGKYIVGIFYHGDDQNASLYVKAVLAIVVLGYIGRAVWKIVKLNKQEKVIEDIISKVHAGAKATNISEYKEYRITIWLGKITYRMCPVEFCQFSLDTDPRKFYAVAVHPAYITDFKNYLSGVDLDVINQKISDIYTGGDDAASAQEEVVDDNTPVKTLDEYKEYLKGELGDTVEEIDTNRAKSRSLAKVFMVFAVIAAVAWMGYVVYTSMSSGGYLNPMKIVIPMAVIFGGYYVVYFLFLKPKVAEAFPNATTGGIFQTPEYDFKNRVFDKIVKFVSPGAEYVMHGHVNNADILASGLFSPESNYKLSGNDLILGRHHGVPFQFCDLTVEVQQRFTKENEAPPCAFYGQFFMARFNKSFSSPVYLVPKRGVKGFFFDNSASTYMQHSGDKIQLEDPEFMEMFNVYGGDQIEARYILSTSLMERIKELAKRTKGQFYIAFFNNRITVANNSGKNNFEIKSDKSLIANDYKILTEFYQDLVDQFAIIDDLKLNIKIWKQ